MAATKQSPLLRSYRALQKEKRKYCEGKSTKADVDKKAKSYIDRAVKSGQTKTEATKKANRVKSGGCSMSSRINGTKKTNSRKKSTTRRRK